MLGAKWLVSMLSAKWVIIHVKC